MRERALSTSRRSWLKNSLCGAFVGFAGAQQEQHHRITPEPKLAHQDGSAINDNQQDPIRQALQQKVAAVQGFDPMRFLTSFDYGRETDLGDGRKVREFKITAKDVNLEIVPGIFFPAWTYNNSVPGPTLRCKQGDIVKVHFANESLSDHSIHFHGIHPANMDGVFEIVKPGNSNTYEFVAEPFGLQFYHCHVSPISLHMNRGLFGAVIIDPPIPRAKAKEMVMIAHGWDINFDSRNEIYALNGPANFYRDNPITIRVGELVRIYFINALEFDPINSIHLHANFFNVYRTGSMLTPDEYTDVIALSQSERCVIEFSYRFPGRFMFHAHQNTFADLGWMGHFDVVGQ